MFGKHAQVGQSCDSTAAKQRYSEFASILHRAKLHKTRSFLNWKPMRNGHA
jgi:hypothetical protein